jgi:hypothetical protein
LSDALVQAVDVSSLLQLELLLLLPTSESTTEPFRIAARLSTTHSTSIIVMTTAGMTTKHPMMIPMSGLSAM